MFQIGFHPLKFIVYFIHEMRNHKNIRYEPSIRQGISYIKLLIGHFFRTGTINLRDIIDNAVSTTFYEDQEIARTVAYRIVVSLINESMLDGEGIYSVRATTRMLETNLIMENYFEDSKILQKLLNVNYEELDWEKLSDIIYETKQEEDGVNVDDIKLIHSLGSLDKYMDDILQNSGNLEQILAKYLNEDDSWKDQLRDLLTEEISDFGNIICKLSEIIDETEDLRDVMKEALKNQKDLAKYEDVLNKSLEKIQKNKENQNTHEGNQKDKGDNDPTNEDELIITSKNGGKNNKDNLEKEDDKELMELNKLKDAFKNACEELQSHDDNYRTDFLSNFFQNLPQSYRDELEVENYVEMFHDSPHWAKSFQDHINKTVNSLSDLQKSSFFENLLQEKKKSGATQQRLKKELNKALKSMGNNLLSEAKDQQSFMNQIQKMMEESIPIDSENAQKKSEELQMDGNLFNEILKKPIGTLKSMIEQKIDDFEQYTQIIQQAGLENLKGTEMKELIKNAVSMDVPSFLGAMANFQLKETLSSMKALGLTGEKDLEKLFKGLAAGSGADILVQWFNSRESFDKSYMSSLLEFANKRLLDLSLYYAKKYFGFIKEGNLLDCYQLRYFREGDSIEKVDIDATLDNIITQGKTLEFIQNSDILCKKEEDQTMKFVLIIDTSGSMDGEKMVNASLSSTLLLHSLKWEDFSILTFNSNTYIVKNFNDKKPIETLANDLLKLKAEGGTMIKSSLEYLQKTLKEMENDQKLMVFLFSDMFYYEKSKNLINILKNIGASETYFLHFSKEKPQMDHIRLFQRFLNFKSIEVPSFLQMPELLSHALFDFRG